MTTTAGQVAVKLNLDKKQFETGMKEAKRSVDLLGSAFSSIAALGIGATLLNIGKNALKASSTGISWNSLVSPIIPLARVE